jgi:hypothetical protein
MGISTGYVSKHWSHPPVRDSPSSKTTILINDNGCPCLAGFGVPMVDSDWPIITPEDMGSDAIRCMIPELLDPLVFGRKKRYPTQASDCYALGMVIYEVLSGQTPYASYSQPAMISKILDGERPGRPEGDAWVWFTAEIWEMLELCWKPEPDDRPSANNVLRCLQDATRPSWPTSTDADDQADIAVNDSGASPPFHPWPTFNSPCAIICRIASCRR